MFANKLFILIFGIFLIFFSKFILEGKAFAQKKGMALIPSGTFLMGTNHSKESFQCAEYFGNCSGNWYTREEPLHTITIDTFFLDKKEVSQGQYFRLMGYNPSSIKGAKLPVAEVTWFEANQYCQKIDKRLPTEAEWEYAARAGTGFNYYWGQKIGLGNANCDKCGTIWDQTEPSPIGSFPPNLWGLYDMTGNIWEWVKDWFDPNYYSKSPQRNPRGPKKGKFKVARGGSWYDTPYFARNAFRNFFPPAIKSEVLGFRCAKTPNQKEISIISKKGNKTTSESGKIAINRKEIQLKKTRKLPIRSKDVIKSSGFSQSPPKKSLAK